MNPRPTDVAIIGAGIVGAACAESLTRAGLSTTVVEPRGPGSGTTSAAMGHLVIMDDSPAQFALTKYSRDLWQGLAGEMPAQVELDRCGTLWVATDDQEMVEVRRKAAFYQDRGVQVQILDGAGVARCEPNLRPGMAGGLRVPGDCVVYPPAAADWLLNRSRGRKAQLIAGEAVAVGSGTILLRDGSRISAGAIINAAGLAAAKLTPGISIHPRKGHLLITDRYPGFVHHQIIELGYLKSAHNLSADSVAFNIQPRATGQMLVGSSRQYGSTDSHVDHAILRRMLDRAIEYLPALARLQAIRVWTGFRPATPDKLPLIGPAPGLRGVYLAAGHEGLGITTSLGTAELLTAQILGRKPPIPIEPYLPERPLQEVTHA